MTHDLEWYYNLVTGQVEQYEGGPAEDRLGPYPSRLEAEQALQHAQQRNDAWENDPRFNDPDEDEEDAEENWGTSAFDTFKP
ncbi:MAG: hypothetical protein Q4F65_11470 [Propionibacteriaceae bacterium]|nr:hypothetical protein [Propionibacteriaceae bacterium]